MVTSVGSKEGDSAQRGPSPPSCGPDPGGAGPTWGRSVLRRFPPPAARPRSSCITSWAPITRGSWWKASTSARCWSPRCFPRGGCGPRTCWWVGVSDVDPRPFFSGDSSDHGSPMGPLVRVRHPTGECKQCTLTHKPNRPNAHLQKIGTIMTFLLPCPQTVLVCAGCHRLHGLYDGQLLLTVMGDGTFEIRVPAGLSSGEGRLSGLQTAVFLLSSHSEGWGVTKECTQLWALLTRELIPS